ncbi:Alpha/Beta hydrolase protein [Aspergillus californicus]
MATQFSTVPINTPCTPEPFTLHVPETDIDEFQQLLRLSKIGPPTWWNQHDNGQFGVSRDWLTQAKETWLSDFNWRKHEEQINSVPNFKLDIHDPEDGQIDIHFAGLFSARKDATPIIFLHGYPGSFMEFLPMMQLLVRKYTPETLPYHVIVPSLPDYGLSGGFSENIKMTLHRAARTMNQLMVELGFGAGYIAQGGDLGSMLARMMSVAYEGCKAFHVNMLVANPGESPSSDDQDLTPTPEEQAHLDRSNAWQQTGFAYALEHGTRPSTVGLAISSSPLALLAWYASLPSFLPFSLQTTIIILTTQPETRIGEKHLEWSDPRTPLPLDTILSITSFYWFTSTFPRGLYHAELVKKLMTGAPYPTSKDKPMGYSLFAYDLALMPRVWAERAYPKMVFFKAHDAGGHFGALEQPGAFLEDVEEFVDRVKGVFYSESG